MIKLDDLNDFLTGLMGELPKGVDIRANGLQVPGKQEIKRIGFGVSASLELFKLAHEKGCDALIVHHGIEPQPDANFSDVFLQRLKFLQDRGVSLFGYHYLLDAHPEIGHAALIVKALKGKCTKPYYEGWGWYGELDKSMNMDEAIGIINKLLGREALVYREGPSPFTKIVVVAGGGAPREEIIRELMDEGIELYITGETKENTRELMREAGINFISGGHYSTECIGLKALMKIVKKEFDIAYEWLEFFNEI